MKILNGKRGFGLGGIILAVVIVAAIAVAGFDIHVMLKRSLMDQEARFIAVNLANSQLEDMKEKAKTWLLSNAVFSAGTHDSNITPADIIPIAPIDFEISYVVVDRFDWAADGLATDPISPDTEAEYKAITITCTYPTSSGVGGEFVLRGALVE